VAEPGPAAKSQVVRLRPALNQEIGSNKHEQSHHKGGDPVLHSCSLAVGRVPREEARQLVRRLGEVDDGYDNDQEPNHDQ
jgi:hypothetical protein